jgi:hypothetical protein
MIYARKNRYVGVRQIVAEFDRWSLDGDLP